VYRTAVRIDRGATWYTVAVRVFRQRWADVHGLLTSLETGKPHGHCSLFVSSVNGLCAVFQAESEAVPLKGVDAFLHKRHGMSTVDAVSRGMLPWVTSIANCSNAFDSGPYAFRAPCEGN